MRLPVRYTPRQALRPALWMTKPMRGALEKNRDAGVLR